MPNITIQVSDELYQHARLAAALRNMSVSALIRALLLTIQKDPGQPIPPGHAFEDRFRPLGEFNIALEAETLADEQHQKNIQRINHARF